MQTHPSHEYADFSHTRRDIQALCRSYESRLVVDDLPDLVCDVLPLLRAREQPVASDCCSEFVQAFIRTAKLALPPASDGIERLSPGRKVTSLWISHTQQRRALCSHACPSLAAGVVAERDATGRRAGRSCGRAKDSDWQCWLWTVWIMQVVVTARCDDMLLIGTNSGPRRLLAC